MATRGENNQVTPLQVLQETFGHAHFKPQQQEIIARILKKEGHTLGIMPTGGGKSLCFQIPALCQKNLTIVVSPLIALMKDQIDNLVKKKIDSAFFINSSIPEATKESILNLVKSGKVKLLYLAPESLKSEKILDVLKEVKIDLFVIDEAHCISTWGHSFRPDYLRLPAILKELSFPQILALTATATKEVEADIQQQLNITCKIFKASFDRPNLFIAEVPLKENVKKDLFLAELFNNVVKGPTVIFASYRKTTEKLSALLNEKGIRNVYYHAGLDREEREKIQNQFITGECDVIIATLAFGMGIDKANIRNIVHFNLPQSLENYYQEIGRAGRDGNLSNCLLLFTKRDEFKIKKLISSNWPDEQKIKDVLIYLSNKQHSYFFTTSRKIFLDCDVPEIAGNLILYQLEKNDAIRIYSNVLEQIKPLFPHTYDEIIAASHPKYKPDLKQIFSCEFFKSRRRSWLSFEEIIVEKGLNYFRIIEIFNYLQKNDFVTFPEVRRKNLIWVKQEIQEYDVKPLVQLFNSLLEHDLEKVNLLIKCITAPGCIRKNILQYFDEPHLKDCCEMCSHCLGDTLTSAVKVVVDENYAPDEKIASLNIKIDKIKDAIPIILLKLVARETDILEKDFINILVGDLHHSSARWKADLYYYGFLPQFKNKKTILEGILENVIQNKQLMVEIDGTVRITKKGIEYLRSMGE